MCCSRIRQLSHNWLAILAAELVLSAVFTENHRKHPNRIDLKVVLTLRTQAFCLKFREISIFFPHSPRNPLHWDGIGMAWMK